MGKVDTVDIVAWMHAEYDVWKHDIAVCMPDEDRAPNQLWCVFAGKQNVAFANHLCRHRRNVFWKSLVFRLAITSRRYGAELQNCRFGSLALESLALRTFS